MKKKVIYTCLVGGYDYLKEPEYVMDDWDYICFSNDYESPNNSIWKVRPIPLNGYEGQVLSRYPKMQPHKLLKEYEFSLYIDSNIIIKSDFLEKRVDELIEKDEKISIASHPERNCVYEEALVCIRQGAGNLKHIKKHVELLRENDYPEKNGLFENNIIFRNHNDPDMIKLGDEWWRFYISIPSKRDQLSLPFLIWKFNIHVNPLFNKGFDLRKSKGFIYTSHKKNIASNRRFYFRFLELIKSLSIVKNISSSLIKNDKNNLV